MGTLSRLSWTENIPIGLIQNYNLLPARREGDLLLREAFDSVTHNINP